MRIAHSIIYAVCLSLFIPIGTLTTKAQTQDTQSTHGLANVKEIGEDTIRADSFLPADTLMAKGNTSPIIAADTAKTRNKRNWATWKPEAKRAMWLALVLPGAGQIYNRKYWKLPIFYGGFVGCAYAMRWNNMMYCDYSQAYLDIMDDDPNTQSYNQFLHLGTQITPSNQQRWQEVFRKRKDKYRRWRDMSFFVMLGVYALSVIDAYVDASLSEFDISPDLSLHVSPTILNDNTSGGFAANQLKRTGLGMQCAITF